MGRSKVQQLRAREEFRRLKPRQRQFLSAYATCASIVRSMELTGIARDSHYRWVHEDANYKAAFAIAREYAMEALEDEAVRRAKEGVRRLVVSRGRVVYVEKRDADGNVIYAPRRDAEGKEVLDPKTGKPIMDPVMEPLVEHEYSDALMCLLLKGGMPERYKERVSQDVKVSGELSIADVLRERRRRRQESQEAGK